MVLKNKKLIKIKSLLKLNTWIRIIANEINEW